MCWSARARSSSLGAILPRASPFVVCGRSDRSTSLLCQLARISRGFAHIAPPNRRYGWPMMLVQITSSQYISKPSPLAAKEALSLSSGWKLRLSPNASVGETSARRFDCAERSSLAFKKFGLRDSGFFRPSDFGLRIFPSPFRHRCPGQQHLLRRHIVLGKLTAKFAECSVRNCRANFFHHADKHSRVVHTQHAQAQDFSHIQQVTQMSAGKISASEAVAIFFDGPKIR